MKKIIFIIAITFSLFSCKQEAFIKDCEESQAKVESICSAGYTITPTPPGSATSLDIQSCGDRIYLKEQGQAYKYFVDVSSIQGKNIHGTLYQVTEGEQNPTVINSNTVITGN